MSLFFSKFVFGLNEDFMPYILLIAYLALSLTAQLLLGDFPVFLLSFPLNLIVFLLWLGPNLWLWNYRRKSMYARFMLSPGATFWALFLFVDACVVVGITGDASLTSSWVFIAILLYLQTVLLMVILRGWREKTPTGARLGPIRWRFLLNHVGLLLALGSAFWGAPDSETCRLKTYIGKPVEMAFMHGVGLVGMDNEIILEDFNIERSENGTPSSYEAVIAVDGENASLKVNHPYRLSFGKDLYLVGYDTEAGEDSDYCIMQVVYEPWRYGALAGIIMMLAGAFLLFIQGPRKQGSSADL